MATTTYYTALSTILEFAKANGFDNEEVIEKVTKLRDQKATKSKTGQKSKTRGANEKLAVNIVSAMREHSVDEVKAAWVRDNVDGINTPAKAVAVLNAGMDAGLFATRRVEKSATRSELVYILNEDIDDIISAILAA